MKECVRFSCDVDYDSLAKFFDSWIWNLLGKVIIHNRILSWKVEEVEV